MTSREVAEQMKDIFGHRIDGDCAVSGKWLVWRTAKSAQTLAKFVSRARDAGIAGVWARDGRVGCLDPGLDA